MATIIASKDGKRIRVNRAVIEIGKRYKDLTVLNIVEVEKGRHNGFVFFNCECVCGVIKEIRSDLIGRTVSCGCARAKHRKSYSKESYQLMEDKKLTADKTIEKPKPGYSPSRYLEIESKREQLRLERENDLDY